MTKKPLVKTAKQTASDSGTTLTYIWKIGDQSRAIENLGMKMALDKYIGIKKVDKPQSNIYTLVNACA